MTDIGDEVTTTTTITVDGILTDPATIELTVTAPDGTTSTPPPTNPSTGVYEAEFTVNAAGRWLWTWSATDPESVEHGHIDVRTDPPRLEPLASISDLEDRVGSLSADQAARAGALLRDASAAVRSYCKQSFDLVENDTAVLRPVGADLILPQRPVLAVHSVAAIPGESGQPDITLSGWQWDGLDRVKVGGVGWRTAIDYDIELSDSWWGIESWRVTYDHGYATTPDDVVAVVCGMVNRILTAPTMTEGYGSERVGPFSYSMAPGQGTPGPQVRLTQADKDALADAGYRRRSGTIQVRA